MKAHKIDNDRVLPVLVSAVDVHWFPCVRHKRISDIEHDYRRYCWGVDNDGGLLANVSADAIEDLDGIFAQKALARLVVDPILGW